MKRLIAFFSACLFALTSFANDEIVVPSTMDQVTVYSRGAQIFRTAKYSIRQGTSVYAIEGISPHIDPNSLQVKASGKVIILDSKYDIKYPEPKDPNLEGLPLKIRKAIERLEDSIFHLNFNRSQNQNELDLYNSSKRILAQNGAIRGEGKVNDSIELLQKAMDYYTRKVLELNKLISGLQLKMRDQDEELKDMQRRLRDLKNFASNAQLNPKPQGPTHRILITLSSDITTSGGFEVSYLVNNAGWIPLYDLRADASASSINLNYKAQVYQNTGVDWDKVKLNLSTNDPYQNKTLPLLHPWYVDAPRVTYGGQAGRPRKYEEAKMQYQSVTEDEVAESPANAGYRMNMDAQTAADFTQTVEHLISAEFRIDLNYSIPSNNQRQMVLIKNIDLKSKFKYYSVPKYDQHVYLMAEIADLADHQLVPAQANIFFDGSYIGETMLNPGQMQDTMSLSLGRDPNILIKRRLLQNECKDKVIGSTREKIIAYQYEVRNLKSQAVEVYVLDQMPLSTNSQVEIEALELSKGKVREKDNQVEWKLKLKPKESEVFDFKYRVKHDKDIQVYL